MTKPSPNHKSFNFMEIQTVDAEIIKWPKILSGKHAQTNSKIKWDRLMNYRNRIGSWMTWELFFLLKNFEICLEVSSFGWFIICFRRKYDFDMNLLCIICTFCENIKAVIFEFVTSFCYFLFYAIFLSFYFQCIIHRQHTNHWRLILYLVHEPSWSKCI